jgi:hypothetical protein
MVCESPLRADPGDGRRDDHFRIVEFRLPAAGALTRLGADGVWRWSELR